MTDFGTSLASGAVAGTAVDLLFYPLDTVKTRLQAKQGFIASGGFKGVYRGLGSVVVGSAPGGQHRHPTLMQGTTLRPFIAALFFTTYERLKSVIPKYGVASDPVNHMLSASGGEIVRPLSS